MEFTYVVVEGPHDLEFFGRLLKIEGFSRVTGLPLVPAFWHPVIPKNWPIANDLARRVPVPVFFQNGDKSVALHSAVGDSRIPEVLSDTVSVLGGVREFSALATVLDCDSVLPAVDRFEAVRARLVPVIPDLPNRPGEVSDGRPRTGVFVIPDNTTSGTLEDLLLDCANTVMPSLLMHARRFVSAVRSEAPGVGLDLSEINKPAGVNKATISSIGSILRPGKSLQVSIQDDPWVSAESISLHRVAVVRSFVLRLLGL